MDHTALNKKIHLFPAILFKQWTQFSFCNNIYKCSPRLPLSHPHSLPTTRFIFFLFSLSPSFFSPPTAIVSVWKGLCLTDTQQDYHHSTQETTHLSLLIPPFLSLGIQLPIYPSIDCHYSWTSVNPLLLGLRFPFPPLGCLCVLCACLYI